MRVNTKAAAATVALIAASLTPSMSFTTPTMPTIETSIRRRTRLAVAAPDKHELDLAAAASSASTDALPTSPAERDTDGLTQAEISRYSRHLILPQVGVKGQVKLKQARVLCVGAGGLGSPLLLYLAAAGIGTIGIVDADVVDDSNLQRQVRDQGTDDAARPARSGCTDQAARRRRRHYYHHHRHHHRHRHHRRRHQHHRHIGPRSFTMWTRSTRPRSRRRPRRSRG